MSKNYPVKDENSGSGGFYILLTACIVVLVLSLYLIMSNVYTNQEEQKIQPEQLTQEIPKIPAATVTTQKPSATPVPTAIPTKETFLSKPKPAKYVIPVHGDIIKEFSVDKLVYSQSMDDWRTHNGIDIKAELDAAVTPIADGTIEDVYTDPFMGVTVVVSHADGIKSFYSNLVNDEMAVKGKSVTSSTVIGGIGTSAACEALDAPHLHLEVTKNGDYVNPMDYVK